jgi:hypothetical protein
MRRRPLELVNQVGDRGLAQPVLLACRPDTPDRIGNALFTTHHMDIVAVLARPAEHEVYR